MKVVCQFRFKDGRVENHPVRPCRGEDLPELYTIIVDAVESGLFGDFASGTKHVFEKRKFRHPDFKHDQVFYEEV